MVLRNQGHRHLERLSKRIVFSSSATVYSMDNEVPFTVAMPTFATNPYGYTKEANERFLQDISAIDPKRVCDTSTP